MFAGKIIHGTGALICVALVSGCVSGKRDSFTVGSVPSDYRTNHPIVLSDKEQVLDIPVSAGARKLSYEALSNVKSFVSRYTNSGTGVIVMMMPSGSVNEVAAGRVKHQVRDAIKSGGGHIGNVAMQSYDASRHGTAAPIRLSYRAVTASTGKCGQWSDDLNNTAENKNYGDFGCSTQNNLAAQIANPSDLLGPRAESPIDAERRATVISDYRSSGNP